MLEMVTLLLGRVPEDPIKLEGGLVLLKEVHPGQVTLHSLAIALCNRDFDLLVVLDREASVG